MTFSFPTIKELIKILSIDRTSIVKHMKQVGEKFYYLHSSTEEWSCAVIYEDDSFTTLIEAFSNNSAVVILNENQDPICCITAQQMIPFSL